MARVLKSPPGVTLAEAILALGLSVVVVLMAVALAITALRSNQKSADQTVACSWGGKVLENFVYSLPPSTDSFWSSSTSSGLYLTDNVVLGTTPFKSELFVTDLASVGAGTKLVTVNVSWGSGVQGRTGYGQQVASLARLIYAH